MADSLGIFLKATEAGDWLLSQWKLSFQPSLRAGHNVHISSATCHMSWQNVFTLLLVNWITSWNQDRQEKYQQPQICRWYHSNGRKWKGTKEPLDESERGDWQSCSKLNIQKTKIMASSPITSWQILIEREKVQRVIDFISLGSKITADGDYSHEINRHLLLGRKAMTNPDSILKQRNITLLTKVWKLFIAKAVVGPQRRLSTEELMLLKGAGKDSWESFGHQRDQTSQS